MQTTVCLEAVPGIWNMRMLGKHQLPCSICLKAFCLLFSSLDARPVYEFCIWRLEVEQKILNQVLLQRSPPKGGLLPFCFTA